MSAPEAPARLVIRLPNWLGDAVMALPAIAAVREAFPRSHLAFAVLGSIAPVFQERTAASPQQILQIDRSNERDILSAGEFDAILLLTNSFRTAWTARLARIPERWGYGTGVRAPLLTRAVSRPRQEVHQVHYYLSLVRGLGLRVDDDVPRIHVTERSRGRAHRLLEQHGVRPGEPIVGFAPGAAYGHAKRWPTDRVAQVVGRLTAEGVRCVLVGAPADRAAGREIESHLPAGTTVANLIGRTDLQQLIGLLDACAAFVSNDSGAMHLAAAVGTPVTGLFGPTKAHVTAPLGGHDILRHDVFCSPCMLRECPIDHRCMKRISVDEVYGAVRRRIHT